MIKILLAFLIFNDISSKTLPELKYGIETPFNKTHYEFNIETSNKNLSLIFYINIENKELYASYMSKSDIDQSYPIVYNIKYPGNASSFNILENAINTITFATGEGEELKNGTICIYPLDRNFSIDLSEKIDKKYEILFPGKEFEYEFFVYTITNIKEDKIIKYKYGNSIKRLSFEINDLENPFIICQGDNCKENVNIYTLLKGQDYTIKIKFEYRDIQFEGSKDKDCYAILPSYSFYEIKPYNLEYNIETPFNRDNNIFNIDYNDKLSYIIIYVNTENINLNITFFSKNNLIQNYDSHIFKSPGGGYIFNAEKKNDIIITINSLDNNKEEDGTILIQPLNINLNIDLSQKIEKKYTIEYEYNKELEPLIYTVSNLNKDKYVVFNYEKEYKNEKGESFQLSNPFRICRDEKCVDNVYNYTFLKGEQYTIRIKFEKKAVNITANHYFLPAYSFYEGEKPNPSNNTENKNKNKVKKVLLIIVPFVIVLVIIAILFIFVYKKKYGFKRRSFKNFI